MSTTQIHYKGIRYGFYTRTETYIIIFFLFAHWIVLNFNSVDLHINALDACPLMYTRVQSSFQLFDGAKW